VAAEDPAAAVHVEDRGEGPGRVGRRDDADPDVADLGGDRDPPLVHVGLVDRRGLEVVEDLPGAVGPELEEERRLGGRVGDVLGRRLEDVFAHGLRSWVEGTASRASARGGCDRLRRSAQAVPQ
jgi:hypothetical protein